MGWAAGGLRGAASVLIGARPRPGESENCSMTYWKTSKSGIPKLSITASSRTYRGRQTYRDPTRHSRQWQRLPHSKRKNQV